MREIVLLFVLKIIYILYLSPIFISLTVGSVCSGMDYCFTLLNNIPESNLHVGMFKTIIYVFVTSEHFWFSCLNKLEYTVMLR